MEKFFLAPIRINIPDLGKIINIGNLELRKIKENEKLQFFGIENVKYDNNGNLVRAISKKGNTSGFSDFDDLSIKSCQHVIICKNRKLLLKELKWLLLAFRLYREGNIYSPIVYSSDGISLDYIYPSFINEKKQYIIYKKEIKKIKEIISMIEKHKDNLFILAIERFNNAISRKTNIKNSFIDFVTILESLFLKKTSNQELSFKFSLITSFILKNNIGIDVNFKEMKNIYKARSQLVHIGRSNEYSTERYIKLKTYTRSLLFWILRNYEIYGNNYLNMILKKLNLD